MLAKKVHVQEKALLQRVWCLVATAAPNKHPPQSKIRKCWQKRHTCKRKPSYSGPDVLLPQPPQTTPQPIALMTKIRKCWQKRCTCKRKPSYSGFGVLLPQLPQTSTHHNQKYVNVGKKGTRARESPLTAGLMSCCHSHPKFSMRAASHHSTHIHQNTNSIMFI